MNYAINRFLTVVKLTLPLIKALIIISLLIIIQGCSGALVVPACEYAGKCPDYFDFEKSSDQVRSIEASANAIAYYNAKSTNDWKKANEIKNNLINSDIEGITNEYWEEIESGVVKKGMSPLQVLCAWGKPHDSGQSNFPPTYGFYSFFDYAICKTGETTICEIQRIRFKDSLIGSWVMDIVEITAVGIFKFPSLSEFQKNITPMYKTKTGVVDIGPNKLLKSEEPKYEASKKMDDDSLEIPFDKIKSFLKKTKY
jgi:hypothetical protein